MPRAVGTALRLSSLALCTWALLRMIVLPRFAATRHDFEEQWAEETGYEALNLNANGGGMKYIWSKGFGLAADRSAGPYSILHRPWKLGERAASVVHGRLTADAIKDGDLVWIGIYHLPKFVSTILPYTRARFAIVTGDGDDSVPAFSEPDLEALKNGVGGREINPQMLHTVTEQILASPNVLHWFAQNACGRYEQRLRRCHVEPRWAKKLVAIPIGLDMHTLMVSGHEAWDSRGRRTIRQQTSELDEIVSRLAPVEQRVVAVYVGFSKTTSPVIRGQWLEYFSTVNFAASQKKPMERRFLFKRIGQFAFVASPPGNGFDCHRTWEALILGCIVIVQNSSVTINTMYEDLAVAIVDDIRQVTRAQLQSWLKELGPRTRSLKSRRKLELRYWHSMMREKVRLALQPTNARGHGAHHL